MMKGVPLTPVQAKTAQAESIPDFVVDAFNELIVKGMNSEKYIRSSVSQTEVTDLICKSLKENEKVKLHWLNIETLYERAGWIVKYEKDENGNNRSFFTFTAKTPYDL
jgi:hypothetical protein